MAVARDLPAKSEYPGTHVTQLHRLFALFHTEAVQTCILAPHEASSYWLMPLLEALIKHLHLPDGEQPGMVERTPQARLVQELEA